MDLEVEEDEEVAAAEHVEVPGFRVKAINSQLEATHGLILLTTHVYITRTEIGAPPTQMLSVVLMTKLRKTSPLATELSARRERKILRKEKSPRKIPIWKKKRRSKVGQ